MLLRCVEKQKNKKFTFVISELDLFFMGPFSRSAHVDRKTFNDRGLHKLVEGLSVTWT